MDKFVRILRTWIPQFVWSVDTLCLESYRLCQSRTRVFLRGVRKILAESVPPPLKPWGYGNFRDSLGGFPNAELSELTRPQQRNLKAYERKIKEMVRAGKLSMEDIVTVALDRSQDGVFQQGIYRNKAPTFTCRNRYMFLISVKDVVGNREYSEFEFFRFIVVAERLALQGFEPEILNELDTTALALKASGNAYPVPLIIAALHPILKLIANPKFKFKAWPPRNILSSRVPEIVPKIMQLLLAKGGSLKTAASATQKTCRRGKAVATKAPLRIDALSRTSRKRKR